MKMVYGFLVLVTLATLLSPTSATEISVEVLGPSGAARANWDEVARKRDPVGFVSHVRMQLESDLVAFRKSRTSVQTELTGLVSEVHDQQARLTRTEKQAGRLRRAYNQAKECGNFPVSICGKSFTEDQLRCKIRLSLAEIKGYKDRIKRMEDARYRAEVTFEQLEVRVKDTEACITVLATEIALLRYHELPVRGEELLTSVSSVIAGNATVRRQPFEVLYAECKPNFEAMVTERELRCYLQTQVSRGKTKSKLDLSDVSDLRSKPAAKPIFQQY